MDAKAFDLKCRYCGAALSAENLIGELAMARCVQCNSVSGVKGITDWAREPATLPEGLRLESDGDSVVISYDGGGMQYWALVFMAAFGGSALFMLPRMFPRFSLYDMASFILPVGAAMFFAVADATGYLHRVKVRVSKDGVGVTGGGLLPFNKTERFISAHFITQLCTRRFTGKESGTHYEVVAKCRDGSLDVLIHRLPDAPHALYLEQKIERVLGLKDIPIPGELPRSERPRD